MNIGMLNKVLVGIGFYFIIGFVIIYLNVDFTLFGVVWELTFLPLLLAGFILAIVLLSKLVKGFNKSAQHYFSLVLSLTFYIYFASVVFSILL